MRRTVMITLWMLVAGTFILSSMAQIHTNAEFKSATQRTIENIDRLGAELAMYRSIAEADGWTATLSKKNGVWVITAHNTNGAHVTDVILYDKDKK